MKKQLNIGIILIMCLALLGACTKNFETYNTNPNQPSSVPTTNHFGAVIVNFSENFSPGSMGAQHANYVGSRLGAGNQSYLSVGEEWGGYYAGLTNINRIIAGAEQDGKTNMLAAALTFRAQMTQVATDQWRDMPYSEASKAAEGIIAPKFDKQEDIYKAIIDDLKKAADLFKAGGNDPIGEGDVLNGGDVAKWQMFCNSLRLRVAVRISNVDLATSTSIINELFGNPADYPVLGSNADNIELRWPGTSPWEEGFWYWWYCCHHEGGGKIVVDLLNNFNDPRLPIWFVPATTDGKYRGSERVGFVPPFIREDISDFNPVFVSGNPNPTGGNEYNVNDGFFRYSEICFLKAEIALRTGQAAVAQAEYEKGITASMQQYGVSDAAIAPYLATEGVAWQNNADDLKKIYTQKYLALFLMNNEAWADARRTDVPLLPPAYNSAFPDHNRAPFRLPYPLTEAGLNSVNLKEYEGNIKDYFWGQKMWWDVRTGVQ
ncbi:MAG: SusD/RagB family nutrient-binding outer membrane lipoprotein [Bacteroidales bacterium]